MGYQTHHVDISAAVMRKVVREGQRFNGISVIFSPEGVLFYIKLGNNPITGPYSGTPTWVFGADTPPDDLRWGLECGVVEAVPNGIISIDISYAP